MPRNRYRPDTVLSQKTTSNKKLSKTEIEKRLAKALAAKERQIQKQRDRLNDPEYRASMQQKRADSSQRSIERQRVKQNSPAYREKMLQRQKEAQQRQRDKIATWQTPRPIAKKITPIKSKGMMGRARTAAEKRLEPLIAELGCICCRNQGWVQITGEEGRHHISLHHVEGRTKPWAHAMQLPLCQYHHDTVPSEAAPEGLFPLHGSGRKRWEGENGTQVALLQQVYREINKPMPWLEDEVSSLVA